MDPQTLPSLRNLLTGPLGVQAFKPLKEGNIRIVIDDIVLTLQASKGQLQLLEQAGDRPDVVFTMPEHAVTSLLQESFDSVGEVGIAVLKKIAEGSDEARIRVKVQIGFFELYRKGYLSVLALGGPSVMNYLATKGFGSIAKIRSFLGKSGE